MKQLYKYKLLIISCQLLILFASCGTVNMLTRVKKTPREYSLNYCGAEDIKAPKTELNKEPWIVYSDMEKNVFHTNPGGKVKSKNADFLDPFLVIKQKNDYLSLIKYTPDILKNGKLDYKKAEYYGWIHKSKLLLNQQSVTDLASGKKNKMIVMLSDANAANEPEKYFANDSIFTFKDYKLETPTGSVAPYEIVYQLKQSPNGDKILIAKKSIIKAEEAKEDVLGWISRSMVKNIGQGLHVDIATVPQEKIQFAKVQDSVNPCLTESTLEESNLLASQHKTIQYSPVLSYSVKKSKISYCALSPLPVLDYNNNNITNVNGNHITYKQYKTTVKDLKQINVVFVFEKGEKTIEQFPQLVNVIQNLQPLFEQPDDPFRYQFACVFSFGETSATEPVVKHLTTDYTQIANLLAEKAHKKTQLISFKTKKTWSGLQKAVELFDSQKDATNLIVIMGEKGDTLQTSNTSLQKKIVENNCRIIGFQVYSDAGNAYNNFVLDIEAMINKYADTLLKIKGDVWVSPQQKKRQNSYIEIAEQKNNYRLDFPENSAAQGCIMFPPKGENMPMELLSNNIDTILRQIKEDNTDIVKHMTTAFGAAENNRTQFEQLFTNYYRIDSFQIPSKKIISGFKKEMLGWHLPSKQIVLKNTENKTIGYKLMVSENELTELKEFVANFSKKEVDIKSKTKSEADKSAEQKVCNCPDDNLIVKPQPITDTVSNDSIPLEYASTKKIRKYLYKLYMQPLQACKVCKEKEKDLKQLSLAEAQRRITGCPTADSTLNSIMIKDLKKKKVVTDKQLDELILYFKSKKDELNKAEQFESNGEKYFWVEKKLLP